jgi:hypothetical protein
LATGLTPVFALEGTVVAEATPSAALVSTQGPGSAPVQAEATRTLTQLAVSDKESLGPDWAVSGTGWLLLDSLPSSDPAQVPPGKLAFSSRLLALDTTWQIVPGSLIWDLGKQIIHPSAGFFKTPLNLISRGATGNVPQSTPAAAPQWEEGWVGTKLEWIVGDLTLEDFFSPRMQWSGQADQGLQYLSLPQTDYQNQVRVEDHFGSFDLQGLELVSTGGPASPDPQVHFQTGIGLETNLGDSLTLHAEATLADSLNRVAVTDSNSLTTADQSVAWVPRALAGATWSINNDVSLLAEYEFNGLGFVGTDYSQVLDYAKNRQLYDSGAPDVLGQFGDFSAAQHYGFVRLADNLTRQITGQGWAEVNLQDLSGMDGLGLTGTFDHWALSGSLTNFWGGSRTEAGVSPVLWQLDVQLQFFF